MRKSRSLPTLARTPLCPDSRPSGSLRADTLRPRDCQAPSLRWEHANTSLSCRLAFEERSVWARDSFDVHRPLQQRLQRRTGEKVWRLTDVGNKLAANDGARAEAAGGSWDMWRPSNHCPPPWSGSVYPRAAYAAAACMSASLLQ
mmetsp:Transcript_81650/g.239712  ORF Transcript_81650/g.239712 Transcript_81650/m.239712 type:complete len:145 (-) Transcript_81650:78-512(-)